MTLTVWITLFFSAWAISISPGPGAIGAMAAGLRYNFWPGAALTIGLIIGYITQFIISVVGVATILSTSPTLFMIVKWVGVLYLLYLGIKQYRSPVSMVRIDTQDMAPTSVRALILRGILIDITNPKGAIFLLAVVPQFVDTSQPLLAQYLIICLTLVVVDAIVMLGYTGLAASLMRIMRNPHHTARVNKLFGLAFIAAAVSMAFINA